MPPPHQQTAAIGQRRRGFIQRERAIQRRQFCLYGRFLLLPAPGFFGGAARIQRQSRAKHTYQRVGIKQFCRLGQLQAGWHRPGIIIVLHPGSTRQHQAVDGIRLQGAAFLPKCWHPAKWAHTPPPFAAGYNASAGFAPWQPAAAPAEVRAAGHPPGNQSRISDSHTVLRRLGRLCGAIHPHRGKKAAALEKRAPAVHQQQLGAGHNGVNEKRLCQVFCIHKGIPPVTKGGKVGGKLRFVQADGIFIAGGQAPASKQKSLPSCGNAPQQSGIEYAPAPWLLPRQSGGCA